MTSFFFRSLWFAGRKSVQTKGAFPFDRKCRFEFPEISGANATGFSRVENYKTHFCSLGIFQCLRDLNNKYRSKQNTHTLTLRWHFIDHSSRDLLQTATSVKTSQNKGFKWYNGSARVINLCKFLSQPMQNKPVHHGGIIFIGIKRFVVEFSCS